MKGWRPNWASALPRSAVIVHDLVMVWLSWNGLTLVRYALAGTPVALPPLWSAEDASWSSSRRAWCSGAWACIAAVGASRAFRTCSTWPRPACSA